MSPENESEEATTPATRLRSGRDGASPGRCGARPAAAAAEGRVCPGGKLQRDGQHLR